MENEGKIEKFCNEILEIYADENKFTEDYRNFTKEVIVELKRFLLMEQDDGLVSDMVLDFFYKKDIGPAITALFMHSMFEFNSIKRKLVKSPFDVSEFIRLSLSNESKEEDDKCH